MGLVDALEQFGRAVTTIGESVSEVLDNPITRFAVPVVGAAHLISDLAELGEKAAEQASEWLDDLGAIEKYLATAHSPILQGGQRVISGLRRTTGAGEPEDGVQFSQGASRFTDAAEVLAGAGPTDDWTGGASSAYGADNGRQRDCASNMAATDRGMHEVIAREAAQIRSSRGKLDDQSNWLADVGRATFALGLVPGVGAAMKTASEIQAVTAAVGASSAELQVLSSEVSANASAIEGFRAIYQTVVDGAPTASIQGPGSPPPPPGGSSDAPPGPNASPAPSANGTAPRTGSGGSGPANRAGGSGGGASGSSGSPAVPTPSASAMPGISRIPSGAMPGGSPSVAGGSPSGGGGSPSAPNGAPSSSGSGGVPTDLAQRIQAAVQGALDDQDAKHAKDEDDKDEDGDGIPDAEEDENGDGVPDAEQDVDGDGVPETVIVTRSGSDLAAGGRAPVHIEFDVDPERLNVPMTVTLDRDRPIVVPPTSET